MLECFRYRPACWGWNRTPLNRWICDIWIERKALFADEVVSRCENVTSAWRSQVHSRLKFTQRWFAGSRCPVSSRLRLPRNRTKGTSEVDPGAFEETMENTITTAAAEESVTVPKRKRAKREAYFHVRPRNEFSKREIYMVKAKMNLRLKLKLIFFVSSWS